MIGRFDINGVSFWADDSGNLNAIFNVTSSSKYACKQTLKAAKELLTEGKELTVKVDEKKNKRTLDQNALMWALLTIYADELNGGRTGGVQPEDIYYRMIDKYGVATFLLTIPEAEEELKQLFRVVKKVDVRM